MAKSERVHRPVKKSEYEIRFATTQAQKGWMNLTATVCGPLADTWDFLTRNPYEVTPTNYRLKGELSSITRGGSTFDRWQHKPTRQGDARIWFYVDGQSVYLVDVHTHHPNQTKT